MPNWEELAKQMTVPFGGVQQFAPQQQPSPDMNTLAQNFPGQLSTGPSTATFAPQQMYEAWPMSLAKVLVGMLTKQIDPREVWQGLNAPRQPMTGEEMAQKGIEGALSFSPGNLGVMGGILKAEGAGSNLYKQYLAKMKAEGRPATLTEKDFAQFEKPVVKGEAPDLLSTIRSLQRPGQDRELVSISQLRDKAGMPPEEFDAQLLKLAQEGKVALHEHDFAYSLKPEDRAKLLAVDNPYSRWGKTHYIGVVPK